MTLKSAAICLTEVWGGLAAYGTWYWVDLLKFDALLSLGMVLGIVVC